jgi:Tol biopolymer transport system component
MGKKLIFGLLCILVAASVSGQQRKVLTLPLGIAGTGRTLWWVDREGNAEPVQAPRYNYYFPDISPDGTEVAMTVDMNGNRDIYILELADGTARRLTFYQDSDNQPLWSPDGQMIAYTSGNSTDVGLNGGMAGIFLRKADGTDEPRFVGSVNGQWIFTQSWNKDGTLILVTTTGPRFENFDIGIIPADGGGSYKPLIKEPVHEIQPQISPDGRWLAYCSATGPNLEQVFVRPFPDVDSGIWQVSTTSGNSPRWSPDGKELYYLVGGTVAEAVMAVPIETDPAFVAGKPRVLFRGNYLGSKPNNGIPYAVDPDGKRFLMMK